jgi:hypothetical protein
MLLCQYEECRLLRDNVYMDKGKRDKYGKGLFKLRHDLLKIIVAVREIPKYQNDSNSMKFLRRLEGIIREFHYPLYEAEISKSWSGARYPKRFYNDTTQVAKSDSMSKFPPHRIVKKLFDDMEMHVDHLWGMTENLLSESAVDRGKGKL